MDQKQLTQQELFSNYLQLLNISNYADPESRLSTFGDRSASANLPLRILDTIALCMATGEPGDVITSTFFMTFEQKKFILLSKNADPSSQDLKDGVTLIDLMQNSGSESMLDILPFIAYRGASVIQKRLKKLSELVQVFHKDLLKEIQAYTVDPPGRLGLFKSEFPEMGEEFFRSYRNTFVEETSSTVKKILQDIIKTCVAPAGCANDETSFRKFAFIVSATAALGKSQFFGYYTKAKKVVKTGNTQLSKLWRNIDKISQYIRIYDAILKMKQQGPFTVKWVTNADLMKATDFEFKNLKLDNVWNTIDKIRKSNVEQSFNQENAKTHLRNMNKFWKEMQMQPRHATTNYPSCRA